jgi:uncharacterized protein (TIGR02679 family)
MMGRAGDVEERARQYFRKPGFRRLLKAIWKRYESLERAGGNVAVSEATAEECEAIGGFFGKYYQPGETIVVSLERFERELLDERSAFPLRLMELHLILTGTPLLTKSQRELLADREWLRVFERIRSKVGRIGSPFVSDWMKRLAAGEAQGHRTLRDAYQEEPAKADTALRHAVLALELLESGRAFVEMGVKTARPAFVRLPVLAARTSGDPHALDWKEPAGRLLFYALKEKTARGAADEADDSQIDSLAIREVYRAASIADDDLSSVVHIYLPDASRPVEPAVFTLRQVELMEEAPVCRRLYVVENPSVFSTLLDVTSVWIAENKQLAIAEPPPLLICTSGPASAAALRLMQRCLERTGDDVRLFYSGDFDMQGIVMGLTLAHRFGKRFLPWRFDAATYEAFAPICPGPVFVASDKYRLSKLAVTWDAALGQTVAECGVKLFQENFLSPLVEDWLQMLQGKELSTRDCLRR